MYENIELHEIYMSLFKFLFYCIGVLFGIIYRLFSSIVKMGEDRKNINVTIRDGAENQTAPEAEKNVCGGDK